MSDFEETVTIQHKVASTLSAAAGIAYPVPFPATLVNVFATLGTASDVTPVILDVNKNGTTIFPSQSDPDDRISIAVGEQIASKVGAAPLPAGTNYIYTPYPSTTPLATFAAGDTISVDVDQIGDTGSEGSDLAVTLTLVKK